MLSLRRTSRFGPVPAPLDNLIRLQDARIKLGRAGARSVDFKGDRMAVAPIDLDSRGAKALRERVPEAVFESGRSTVRVRLPEDSAELALFLCSERARHIQGTAIAVDGGATSGLF